MRDPTKKPENPWAQAVFYASLGFIIPGNAVAGYLIGRFLDDALHAGEGFAVAGAFVGAAAGIFEVLQLVKRAEKNGDKKNTH